MGIRASAETIANASAALRRNILETFEGNRKPATVEDIARLYVHCMLTLDTLVYSSELSKGATDQEKQKLLELIESTLDEMGKNLAQGLTKVQNRDRGEAT